MKIVINLNKLIVLLFFFLNITTLFAQNEDAIFLMHHKNMIILNVDETVKLSFDLAGNDEKDCIYNFEIDNMSKDFKNLKFQDIKNLINEIDIKGKKVLTLTELSNYDFCELQILFADTRTMYLIKKEGNLFYKYKLLFRSSQRGWSLIKN
jgi:hypothetical protein